MYNENEPFAGRWLEQLQERNLIPEGRIDARSITQLRPEDCDPTSHFFAGIGGWAYALQLAGWDPARDVWTGSCPCQPFSIAAGGAAKGFSDQRHLWPIWLRLIAQYRPSTIFGEQTSSDLGRQWLSGVRSDLEALGYAVGAADLCAAGVNAPHRRQRLYWVAHTGHGGDRGRDGFRDSEAGTIGTARENQRSGQGRQDQGRLGALDDLTDGGQIGGPTDGMVNTLRGRASNPDTEAKPGSDGPDLRVPGETGLSDFWDQFDIAECRAIDGSTQYRRIEPGLPPVADGLPNRVGRIRGFGNAIVPQLAATFIRAFLEAEKEEE
jgi:DNA (cytosine-5)-methyltransferase 1